LFASTVAPSWPPTTPPIVRMTVFSPLAIPVSLGRMALDRVPGLSGNNADLIRQALADGRSGPVLVIDDEGDGVRIVLE